MTEILISHNIDMLIARIQNQTAALAAGSPKLTEALTRIGLYVSAVAKLNIRRMGLIDTGRLLNSIRYEFFQSGESQGVQVGSFNVPYAAVHEFGYRGTVQIPAHTRNTRFGAVSVRAHSRRMNVRQRPYLRPAVTTSRTFIIDTLRAALTYANG
jgi:phage gpG-like protein